MNEKQPASINTQHKRWRLICDLLDESSESYSDRVLFKDASGKTITYSETRTAVDNLAMGLILSGLSKGDRVGLLGERNSSDWCISYLSILRIGAVVVPLDSGLKTDELASMLADCGASGIICYGKAVETLKKIRQQVNSLETIIAFDTGRSYGVSTVADLITKGEGQTIKFPTVDPDDLAVLIYTSGTTGKPKGVMLSNRNIVSDIVAVHNTLHFVPEDVFLSVLPLHHTLECTCGFLTPMSKGCKIVFARSYKSSELLEDLRDNRISIMCSVPLIFEKMYLGFQRKVSKISTLRRLMFKVLFRLSAIGLKRYSYWGRSLFRSTRKRAGIDSIRMFVSGGAALPFEVGQFFNALGIVTLQGYGLSETSPALSITPEEKNKIDSIGPPFTGVEMRIDNPDAYGNGEIVAKGPMVMLGYYNNQVATDEVLRDGWFFTGDIGHVDEDGYFHITGRSKNVIVSAAGKNIYPEEIEARLNLSDYILESLVLGRKAPGSNVEDVIAVIVPDQEFISQDANSTGQAAAPSVEEIISSEVKSVSMSLADFKRIKKFYIRTEELPKTSTRKIMRSLKIDADGNLILMQRV
ncbi:MAG: AMP-dependent synthetase/ligase [Candidatus Zixiibacteriota bacterium]